MKQIAFVIVFTFLSSLLFAQNNNREITGKYMYRLMGEARFVPKNKMKGMRDKMKAYFLTVDDNDPAFKQGNINAWYTCTKKSSVFYEIWQSKYFSVSKDFWERNCIGLVFLMQIDYPSLMPSTSGQINTN